ncbi:uncharacterized protein [Diadema antillarum]|uniref:uncharacterized protein n=1 Tax=Diadema antillarum TaxID=105358 RepID=UPI003A8B195F
MELICRSLAVLFAIFSWIMDSSNVLASASRIRYALPAPDTGCADNWVPIMLEVSYPNLTNITHISERFHVSLVVRKNDPSNILMKFCMWDSKSENLRISGGVVPDDFGRDDSRSFTSLPEGNYCVYSIGEAIANFQKGRWDWKEGGCPSGFESGFSTLPFNTSYTLKENFLADPAPIPSPMSLFRVRNTAVHYCCTQSGDVDTPIDVPFIIPFFLFPFTERKCQKVRGMRDQLQHVVWPSMQYGGGVHPYFNDTANGENVFYYCYYVPDTIVMETNIIIATYTVMIGTPTVTFIVLCACRFTHKKLLKRNSASRCWLQRAPPAPAMPRWSSRQGHRRADVDVDDQVEPNPGETEF